MDATSQALAAAGNDNMDSAFIRPGEVDWAAFRNSSPLMMAQSLANAGVQPSTHAAALALGTRLRLSTDGQRRMETALATLASAAAFENTLSFGFGSQSYVRLLPQSQNGVNCLALVACLVECHGEGLSASILRELWRSFGFPEEYEPSRAQFFALVKACAGVVSATSFGSIFHLMLPARKRLARRSKSTIHASRAEDTARALHGLFELSKGTVGSINLFGGPECGFIAAIGHFLFDFTLFIEDEGGLPIPISVGEKTQAQIRITYGNHQMDPEDIAVNVVYDLSRTEEPRPPHHYANDLVARVSWQNCLTQAFTGTSLSTLMSQPQQVADYIGSYARILEALAHPEESGNLFRALLVHLPGRDSINDSDIRPQVYGEKFLQSMWTTLPELGFSPEVQSRAVKASSNQSLDPVIKTLLSTVRGWEQLCGCDSCRKQRQYREYIEYDYNFCIISIMRMACRLITDLAGVIREPKLDPTLEGLVNCYKAVHQTGNEPILDRPEGILPHVQSAATVDSFGIVSILFTGRERKFDQLYKQWGPTFESKMSAISHHGICMNIHALESLSSSAEEIGRLYVRPGRIEWRGKGYDVVWDGDYDESKLSDEICLAKNKAFLEIVNPANAMSYDTPRPDGFTISGHVIDDNEVGDLSDVQLVYKIQWPGGESDFLGPSMLTRMILRYSGGIACGHGPDLGVMMDHSHLRSQLHLIQSGWSLHWPDSLPKGVVLWPPQSEIGRCIALLMSYCHQESNRGSEVYIRSGECLACIVGAVDRLNVRRMPEPTTIIV